MKILAIRPVLPGEGNVRARFDVELDNGVKLFDLKLTRGRNGWRVYGPQHHGATVVALPVELADELAREAVANVCFAA